MSDDTRIIDGVEYHATGCYTAVLRFWITANSDEEAGAKFNAASEAAIATDPTNPNTGYRQELLAEEYEQAKMELNPKMRVVGESGDLVPEWRFTP
jgi:hypothetical protein